MDENNFEKIKRRSLNTIYLVANRYDFFPRYISNTKNTTFDFFQNLIIGFSYRVFGESVIEEIAEENLKYRKFYTLDSLIWLHLENSVVNIFKEEYPRILELQLEISNTFLDPSSDLKNRGFALKDPLGYNVTKSFRKNILGEKISSNKKITKLLEIIDGISKTEEELKISVQNIRKICGFLKTNRKIKEFHFLNANLKIGSVSRINISDMKIEDERNFKSTAPKFSLFKNVKDSPIYIESIFGKSILTREENYSLNKKISKDPNRGLRIHIAGHLGDGGRFKEDKKIIDEKIKENYEYLNLKKRLVELEINNLSGRLKDLVEQRDKGDYIVKNYGTISSKRAYKIATRNAKIFKKKNTESSSDLLVTLFIDSSASRFGTTKIIALESYIFIEAMKRSGIKTRVISYRTLGKTTILNILKDYDEENTLLVLNLITSSYNRDSLAVEALEYLTKDTDLVLYLTDANPSDYMKITSKFFGREYSGEFALKLTERAIRELKNKGTRVVGIFTGRTEKIDAANKMFEGEFVNVVDLRNISAKCFHIISKNLEKI